MFLFFWNSCYGNSLKSGYDIDTIIAISPPQKNYFSFPPPPSNTTMSYSKATANSTKDLSQFDFNLAQKP